MSFPWVSSSFLLHFVKTFQVYTTKISCSILKGGAFICIFSNIYSETKILLFFMNFYGTLSDNSVFFKRLFKQKKYYIWKIIVSSQYGFLHESYVEHQFFPSVKFRMFKKCIDWFKRWPKCKFFFYRFLLQPVEEKWKYSSKWHTGTIWNIKTSIRSQCSCLPKWWTM